MYSLIVRMMLRRSEAGLFVFSVALLVALPIAIASISYPLRLYLEQVSSWINPGGLYLVVNGSAPSDSILDSRITGILKDFDTIGCIAIERIVEDTMILLDSGSYRVRLRFIDDIGSYIDLLDGRVEGRIPTGCNEVLLGVSIAERCSLKPNDTVKLTVGSVNIDMVVVGIARLRSQSDYEIISSMDTARILGFKDTSIVEFRFKHGVDEGEALATLSKALPRGIRIYSTRRISEFAYTIDRQIAGFIHVWIIPVYLVLAISSYISSMNLVYGCSYELGILKALGADGRVISSCILAYVALTSILGAILGLSIGLTGVQVASKIMGWINPSLSLTPVLSLYDATIIVSIAVSSSILGSILYILGGSRIAPIEGSL